ncbi:MAG: MarR family transcriptional regulator [Sphingopyxis sp.]
MTVESQMGKSNDYDIARLRVAASPLFLRDAEVARGIGLLLLGQAHLLRAIDPALREAGIGRAHYRMLGHVVRWPGLSMADLIVLSGTSKQALSRVTRDLVLRGYIEVRVGHGDKRRRELRATTAGKAIETALSNRLNMAMAEAYAGAGQDAVTGFWRVLEGLVPVAAHAHMAELTRRK